MRLQFCNAPSYFLMCLLCLQVHAMVYHLLEIVALFYVMVYASLNLAICTA